MADRDATERDAEEVGHATSNRLVGAVARVSVWVGAAVCVVFVLLFLNFHVLHVADPPAWSWLGPIALFGGMGLAVAGLVLGVIGHGRRQRRAVLGITLNAAALLFVAVLWLLSGRG